MKKLELNLFLAGFRIKLKTNDRGIYNTFKKNACEFILPQKAKTDVEFMTNVNKRRSVIICSSRTSKTIFRIRKELNKRKKYYLFLQPLKIEVFSWLVKHDAVVLHASAVKTKKGVILFSGPSTAGKTTIAQIGKSLGLKVVHGNEVIIRREKGKFNVYPCPLVNSKKRYLLSNSFGKLKNVFFIKHGKKNVAKKLSRKDAYKQLLSNDFLIYSFYVNNLPLILDRKLIRKLAETYFALSKKKCFYTLAFKPDNRVWGYLNEKIKD